MTFYNIALYPADQGFAKACAEFSERSFAPNADGYLVGRNAHPHVTLCQFEASQEQLSDVWHGARTALAPILLVIFNGLYFHQGSGRHENHIWAGLSAKRDAVLIEAQYTLARMLHARKLESLTASGDEYFPHLTLARLKKPKQDHGFVTQEPPWPGDLLRSWPICFDLTLGLSDENGVYRQKLFPQTPA